MPYNKTEMANTVKTQRPVETDTRADRGHILNKKPRKENVFLRWDLNTGSVGLSLTSVGSSLQIWGATTAKAWSHLCFSCDLGTTRISWSADLSDLDGKYGCQRVLKGEIVPKSLRSVYLEFDQELEVRSDGHPDVSGWCFDQSCPHTAMT